MMFIAIYATMVLSLLTASDNLDFYIAHISGIHHVIFGMDFLIIIVHHLLDKCFCYIHICDICKRKELRIVFRNSEFWNGIFIS